MIKACDPHSSIAVVWHRDPAVAEVVNADDYVIDSTKNPSIWRERLKMKDGAEPTEWILGVIPSADANAAEDLKGFASRYWHAFLHCVRDVKNPGDLANGLDGRKLPKVTRDGVEYVDPQWLARVMVGPLRRCALDLGLIAFCWNQLSEADAKN